MSSFSRISRTKIYTRCSRKVSDLRSYLRVGAILRHPDRGNLRSSPHLIEPHTSSGTSTSYSSPRTQILKWPSARASHYSEVVEPLFFERHFQFWEHPKVAGSYVGTVRRLAKLYNRVFRQELLHKVRWMRWRVIVVKKPVTAWPETRSFSSHGITQSFQNFNVIFFVDRLTS